MNIDKEVFNPLVAIHQNLFPQAAAVFKGQSSLCPDTLYFVSTIFSSAHWSNGYMENDPMHQSFIIERLGEDEYSACIQHGGSLLITPRPEERHLAYSMVKCPFRKTQGSAQKIIKAIQAWQEKRLALVIEYKTEIRGFANSNLNHL